MIFYKTSSFGNAFIAIDEGDLPDRRADRGLLAREICDGQRAVGADGVVFYRPGRVCRFQVHNRDGGKAELSGNGMAGLAAVLFQRRLASKKALLMSPIGRRRVELLSRRGPLFDLQVQIGRPEFADRRFFPFLRPGREGYRVDGLEFYPVSVGNPHAVVLLRQPASPGQLAAWGKKIEGHSMFPARVNVEFVVMSAAASCRVSFYERGVGRTESSSTGSAAVFAVLRRLGLAAGELTIDCGADRIRARWERGITVRNVTRLVCRGDYFA
jgi:diaminopimelate epimerase